MRTLAEGPREVVRDTPYMPPTSCPRPLHSQGCQCSSLAAEARAARAVVNAMMRLRRSRAVDVGWRLGAHAHLAQAAHTWAYVPGMRASAQPLGAACSSSSGS